MSMLKVKHACTMNIEDGVERGTVPGGGKNISSYEVKRNRIHFDSQDWLVRKGTTEGFMLSSEIEVCKELHKAPHFY